jgi:hypothetical protein
VICIGLSLQVHTAGGILGRPDRRPIDLQYPSLRAATPSGLSASPITDPAHPDSKRAVREAVSFFTYITDRRAKHWEAGCETSDCQQLRMSSGGYSCPTPLPSRAAQISESGSAFTDLGWPRQEATLDGRAASFRQEVGRFSDSTHARRFGAAADTTSAGFCLLRLRLRPGRGDLDGGKLLTTRLRRRRRRGAWSRHLAGRGKRGSWCCRPGASLPGCGDVCAKAAAQSDEIRKDVEASNRGRNDLIGKLPSTHTNCATSDANRQTRRS